MTLSSDARSGDEQELHEPTQAYWPPVVDLLFRPRSSEFLFTDDRRDGRCAQLRLGWYVLSGDLSGACRPMLGRPQSIAVCARAMIMHLTEVLVAAVTGKGFTILLKRCGHVDAVMAACPSAMRASSCD